MNLAFTFLLVLFGTFNEYVEPNDKYHYVHFQWQLEQKQSGEHFQLRCHRHCHKSHSKYRWDFQACGREFGKTSCHELLQNLTETVKSSNLKPNANNRNNNNNMNNKWHKLNRNERCVFDMQNAAQNQSGLYKCVEEENGIDKIQIVYTVEIINGETSKILKSPPSVREVIPQNTTAARGSQINVQCKVISDIPPEIRWFKQVDTPLNDSIPYNNSYYIYVNASSAENQLRLQGVDVYVSKLKIQKAQESDTGSYLCLAMTGSGTDIKETYIYVEGSGETGSDKTSFSLLFLIPLCLALVPITVWLCYFKRKIKSKNMRKSVPIVVAGNGVPSSTAMSASARSGANESDRISTAGSFTRNHNLVPNGARTAYKYNIVPASVHKNYKHASKTRFDNGYKV